MYTINLILVTLAASSVSALPHEENVNNVQDTRSRYMNIPDGEGVLHRVDLEAAPDYEHLATVEQDPTHSQYLLYTRRNHNESQLMTIYNTTSILKSFYNPNLPTIMYAFGWITPQNSENPNMIKNAFLRRYDVNFIILDWHRVSNSEYATAVYGAPIVGRRAAHFIRFLIKTGGGNLKNFYFVGFSLGAHVVGNAGRSLGGKVARITVLDAARPLWEANANRISRHDAMYVEAIHTSDEVGGFGLRAPVGDVDFYVNDGHSQPGCYNGACDHGRAWKLFAATVVYNHLIGNKCKCFSDVSEAECCGSGLSVGNGDVRKSGRGIYRIDTGAKYPY